MRRGRRSDAVRFLELVSELAEFEKLEPPTDVAKRRLVRDVFERKRLKLLLAVAPDHEAIGYALYFTTYSSFLALPTLYIEDIYVSLASRGQGCGQMLFERCRSEALKLGCGRMEWTVLTWNKNAMRFYEKMGATHLTEWRIFRLPLKQG